MSMKERYFVLHLDDPGKPGFVSCDKPYFGNEEVITFAAALMRDNGSYHDTVKGIDDYFNGKKDSTHTVAHRSVRVLSEVDWISEAKMQLAETTWEHTNTWGFPYIMRCDHAFLQQVIVKYNKKYCRCYRAWFDNLCYEGPTGSWNKVTSFWGYRELMLIYHLTEGNLKINNVPFLLDKEYETLEAAVDSLTNPSELCFSSFCDEIFGDG